MLISFSPINLSLKVSAEKGERQAGLFDIFSRRAQRERALFFHCQCRFISSEG